MEKLTAKKLFSSALLMFFVMALCLPMVLAVAPVQASSWVDTSDSACAQNGDCNPCDLVAVTVRYMNGLFYGAGTIAMFMFAFGGIVMLTAYGNENRITWGKNVLLATVVGMFIVFTAWILTSVFIGAFFGNPTGGSQIKVFGNSWNSCPTSGNQGQSNKVEAPGIGEGLIDAAKTTVEKATQ